MRGGENPGGRGRRWGVCVHSPCHLSGGGWCCATCGRPERQATPTGRPAQVGLWTAGVTGDRANRGARGDRRGGLSTRAHWARGTPASVGFPVEAFLRLASVVAGSVVQGVLDRDAHDESESEHGIVGRSQEIGDLRAAIEQQAQCPYPVLIEGETGSGKELVAKALHRSSPRRERAFCAVNCAALSDELFEAELFGQTSGAFPGAVSQRTGLFEAAHRGTLFLDEVGELSPRAQAKLLRSVQEGEVRRVGENRARRVDVRIITATNRSLTKEVVAGAFDKTFCSDSR